MLNSMPLPRRKAPAPAYDRPFAVKPRKAVPHAFVLEAVSALSPRTRPMFGCLAIYVGDKIVLILRDKPGESGDNGVWLATTVEHHESLRREFPSMRSTRVLGKKVTGWQVLPADAPAFRGSRAARLRAGYRPGSSNRQGARSAAPGNTPPLDIRPAAAHT